MNENGNWNGIVATAYGQLAITAVLVIGEALRPYISDLFTEKENSLNINCFPLKQSEILRGTMPCYYIEPQYTDTCALEEAKLFYNATEKVNDIIDFLA